MHILVETAGKSEAVAHVPQAAMLPPRRRAA
jgi:hypothetical protein